MQIRQVGSDFLFLFPKLRGKFSTPKARHGIPPHRDIKPGEVVCTPGYGELELCPSTSLYIAADAKQARPQERNIDLIDKRHRGVQELHGVCL